MASKEIKININDEEVKTRIRRIRKGEFKALVVSLAQKGDELIKLFDGKSDILSILPDIVIENIDFFTASFIEPYVELTAQQLDDMDLVDILELLKELLKYNKIDIEKIINFLNPDPATKETISNVLNFSGIEIPSVK